ncbi:uncharacterized protein MYCGRDRAFT_97259 [Zymoseptoria tritici IPO323]|uniref:Uncharacterized protein n=1 Tax=Zymoseptoria tritici (strain CBS 115943 / IPO323) TaxID=336722 RepID=F9XPM7_ZYMTI|nr:uncharacterized protein MYCGRDRAFT_97259 [Zymoseptoria tritici IPO323]EGP82802.1 hypothetical protein MYCGRDRAFT_97259 [Zymoseptoria tritici IPO323]
MAPKARAPAPKRPAKSNHRAPKPKGPHAASTALRNIPTEPTANPNPTTKPSVPKFDPNTNIGKAVRFQAQVEKAKKARARELEPSKRPLPPPDEFDLEAVEQETKARKVAMRARTANMGGRVVRGEDEVAGAFIVEQTVPGSKSDMWARYHKQQRGGGEVVRNDARAKGPGVESVLKAQGGGFQPLRWEKEG